MTDRTVNEKWAALRAQLADALKDESPLQAVHDFLQSQCTDLAGNMDEHQGDAAELWGDLFLTYWYLRTLQFSLLDAMGQSHIADQHEAELWGELKKAIDAPM